MDIAVLPTRPASDARFASPQKLRSPETLSYLEDWYYQMLARDSIDKNPAAPVLALSLSEELPDGKS